MPKSIFSVLTLFMLLPGTLNAVTSEGELFSEAESRYYAGNYTIALDTYEEFLKRFPLSDLVPDVQYRRALSLFRLGRYRESLSLFEAIDRRYRSTRFIDYVPFWKGIVYFHSKDYSSSLENLGRFLNKTQDKELIKEALLYKALSEISLGDDLRAKDSMKSLVTEKGYQNLSPYEAVLYGYLLMKEGAYDELITFYQGINPAGFPRLLRDRFYLYGAEAFWGKKRLNEAEEIYMELLGSDLRTASIAYRRLYLLAQERGDFSQMEWIIQQAEEKLSQAGEILMDLWMRIGIESFKMGELELSEHFLLKIWNLRREKKIPDEVPMYLSEILVKKGKRDDAKQVLNEYLNLYPDYSEGVILYLGTMYFYEKLYDGVLEIFSQYLEKFPKSDKRGEIQNLLAFSYYKLERFEEALEICNEILKEPNEMEIQRDALTLKVIILTRLGKMDEAYTVLENYVKDHPEDLAGRSNLIKLLFAKSEYQKVVEQFNRIIQDFPELEVKDPGTHLTLLYLKGLSYISLKSYGDALGNLSKITRQNLLKTEQKDLFPYVLFYKGWTLYRLERLKEALSQFSEFLNSNPGHELYPQALYLNAWCYFRLGEYERAFPLFSRLAQDYRGELAEKALFLSGKSLENQNKKEEALKVFERLSEGYPNSSFVDDATFEQAIILEERGEVENAAEKLFDIYRNYPSSPIADEALYKRGEIYFTAGIYDKARIAFYDYRLNFPRGKIVDAALFWEASASFNLGDLREASILWENLIKSYESSPFRPETFRKVAEVYVSLRDYQKALERYSLLIERYPDYAETVNAEFRKEEIRYLYMGLDKREALLTTHISREGGVRTQEGRKAMIELARFYIFEDGEKMEKAYHMLNQVLEQNDPLTAAEAHVLLGEYYYRKNDYVKSGGEFFKASLKNPEDRDLMAYSIYKAAEMMKLAGKTQEVKELLKRLRENFPRSEWALKGEKLLEDVQ